MGKTVPLWFVGMAVLLAGCSAGPVSIAEAEHQGGLPAEAITAKPDPSATTPPFSFPSAGWLDGGAKFAVVLGGSSSCPAFPSSVQVIGPQHLKLGIDTRGGPVCTADLVPRTYIIRTPPGVVASREVTLQYGETTVVLPAL